MLSGTSPGTELTKDGYVTGFIHRHIKPISIQTQVVLILLMVLILHCLIQVLITVVTVDNIFCVRVTDGKAFIVKEFTLYVYGGFDLKADPDEIYADKDDGLIQADTE